MLRNPRGMFVLMLAICAALFFAPLVASQEPAAAAKPASAKASLDRISGTISMIDKDQSLIDVRKGTVVRRVLFNSATKITTMNKPEGTVSDLKEGTKVICLGKIDKESAKLTAAQIDIRK